MGRHRPGIEAREHCHAAENRLDDRSDDGDGSQSKDGAARISHAALTPPPGQRANDGRDGECGEHEGEQSIAELDVLVPGLLLASGGDVGALHALGPRGAAQARSGEAHDPAGHDDPDLGDQVGHKNAAQPARSSGLCVEGDAGAISGVRRHASSLCRRGRFSASGRCARPRARPPGPRGRPPRRRVPGMIHRHPRLPSTIGGGRPGLMKAGGRPTRPAVQGGR